MMCLSLFSILLQQKIGYFCFNLIFSAIEKYGEKRQKMEDDHILILGEKKIFFFFRPFPSPRQKKKIRGKNIGSFTSLFAFFMYIHVI